MIRIVVWQEKGLSGYQWATSGIALHGMGMTLKTVRANSRRAIESALGYKVARYRQEKSDDENVSIIWTTQRATCPHDK